MDLIDRQAAIEKINERQRKLIYCFGFENDMVKIMDIAKSILTAIPPAQPDYKTDHGYMWLCPKCGLGVHSDFAVCVRCGHKREEN